MTPEEIRRRLPGAPEEAIKQLVALDKHHRELMARIKDSKDITHTLDYHEHMLDLIQRWNPTQLEPVVKEIVDTFGRVICKGDKACIRQFEQTLRKLIKLGEIK